MELQTAKEILAEVLGARSSEMEEMIKMRLEESRPEEREEGRWPATFRPLRISQNVLIAMGRLIRVRRSQVGQNIHAYYDRASSFGGKNIAEKLV
jgi:hypothetical protein